MSTGHMPDPPNHLTSQATDRDVQGQSTGASVEAPSATTQEPAGTLTPAQADATATAQTQATVEAQTDAAKRPSAPATDQNRSAPPQPQPQAQATPAAPQAADAQAQASGEQAEVPLNEDMARILEEQVGTIAQKLVYHSQMLFGVGGIGTDPVTAREATLVIASALRNQSAQAAVYSLVNLGDPQIAQVNDRTFPYRFNEQTAGLLEGIIADTLNKAYKDDPAKAKQARTTLSNMYITANEELQRKMKVIPMSTQAPAMGNEFKELTDVQAGTQSQQDAPALLAPSSTDQG